MNFKLLFVFCFNDFIDNSYFLCEKRKRIVLKFIIEK